MFNSSVCSVVVNSVQEQVYKQLYDAIVSLTLKPGTVISTSDIAEKLCVSRTPVREAFLSLKEDGLLDVSPQRPTVVSKINLNRVYQERFVREALELKNISSFVEKSTEEDLNVLKKIIEHHKEKMQEKDIIGMIDLDNCFHRYMLHATGEILAESIISKKNGHYNRMRILSLLVDDIRNDVCKEHEAIIYRIERKASDVSEILKKHLCSIEKQEVILKDNFPEYFS